MNGLVKWFNETKGYGFISCDSKDHFVHFRDIRADGFKTLSPGDEVQFDSEKSPRGFCAKNVIVIKKA